jgi:hypothetical protein
MLDPLKIVLYVEGTFDKADPTSAELEAMKKAAADIGASGFGTVILAFLHPKENGTIDYNDIPISETFSFLPGMVEVIRAGGNVKRVIFSIGGGGQEVDYTIIKKDVPQFEQAFTNLAARLKLDGVDFDLEADRYSTFADLLVELTIWASNARMLVTAPPYQDEAFWVKVIKQSSVGGKSRFAWWNLQVYGRAKYDEWVTMLSGAVDDPQAFLVPGYRADLTNPTELESTLKTLKSSYPSLAGSMVWDYELIKDSPHTAAQYAAAIKAGLGG